MRIAWLSFYSGYVHRGMETVVSELASRWANNHQVMVIQAGPRLSKDKGYRVVRLKTKWQPKKVNPWLRKLFLDRDSLKICGFALRALVILFKFKPEIVLAGNGGWQVFWLKLFSFLNGSKLVVSGQAGLGWDERWNLLLKPDLFVALSQRNASWARKHSWKKQKIALIPNGVDLKRFTIYDLRLKKPRRFIGVTSGSSGVDLPRPIILCVAGPEKYKRVEATIRAVARLKQGSLIVVGGSRITERLGEQLLDSRFLQLKVSHDKMPQVYQGADVFTLVSESTEAFGIAYLEAMACGLPVVATDDRLRREIVGSAGILVKDPQDSLEYAQALKKVLKRSWGDKLRKQAGRFSWNKIAPRYEQQFKRLLK